MATCDQPSDLIHRIAYPGPQRRGLRDQKRIAALAAKEEQDHSVRFTPQTKELGEIFYFIEPRPRNPWAGTGSLVFLSAVVLTLIIVPLLHTDALPKREMLTKLYLQPPAAASSGARRLEAPLPTSSYTPTRTAIPIPVPKTEESPQPPIATSGGIVGGIPGGMTGGILGAVFTEIPSSTVKTPLVAKSPDPMPVKRTRIGSRVAEANLIHDVAPQYPPEAGRARIEGTVVLMAVIGTDGAIKDVRIESGLPILAQAAIDAVRQWRYKPYLIDGEPVEVDSRITINFTLSHS